MNCEERESAFAGSFSYFRGILFWQIRKELKKDLLNIYVLPFGMHSYIIGEESTLLCVAEMSIIVYYTI